MSKLFAFRQRAGTINWNAVSAVDVKEVVEDVKVDELQAILDNITFSGFGVDDIKNVSVETAAKLVQLFQFIVEYLLHCQESQCGIIQRIHKRNESLLDTNNVLKQQNIGLKEDKKIYQRQLSVLRRSIGILQPQPPRVVLDPNNKKNNDNLAPIIESVLQHEKQTRETLKEILEEQKNAFMKGLELQAQRSTATAASSSSASASSSSSESKRTDGEDKRQPAEERLVQGGREQDRPEEASRTIDKEVVQSFSKLLNEIIQLQKTQGNSSANASEKTEPQSSVQKTLAQAAMEVENSGPTEEQREESARLEKLKVQLEVQKRQLSKKESDLRVRDENLKLEMSNLERKRKADDDKQRAKVYLSSVDSLSSLRPPSKDKVAQTRSKVRGIAAMALKQKVVQALMIQVANAFRSWVGFTMTMRDRSQVAEHARLLKSANAAHQKREQDLLTQLDREREKVVSEQARLNTMVLLAEQERDRLQEMLNIANARLQQLETDPKFQSRVTASVSTSVDTPWRTSAGVGTATRGLTVTTSTDSLQSASTPISRTPSTSQIPRGPGISISTSTTSLSPYPFPNESIQSTAATAAPAEQRVVGPAIDPSLLAYVDRKLGGASSEIDALDMFEARIAARRQLGQSRDYGLEGEMSSLAAEIAQRLQVQMQEHELRSG